MNFAVERLKIDEVLRIRARRFDDPRGYFMETWSADAFRQIGVTATFVQDNQSLSRQQGTVRGLHFQTPPCAQSKLVRVLQGAVFDVVVDLRVGSPHYGKWCGSRLSADDPEQLFIPKGFAHGFVTLEPDTVIAYRVDAPYSPTCDAGIYWDDPAIGIDWSFDTATAMLSAKDQALPKLAHYSSPFRWNKVDVVEPV